jgi:hypothetical protein
MFAGIDDSQEYRVDVRAPDINLTEAEGSHLRGFELAIRRLAPRVSPMELLAAGLFRLRLAAWQIVARARPWTGGGLRLFHGIA